MKAATSLEGGVDAPPTKAAPNGSTKIGRPTRPSALALISQRFGCLRNQQAPLARIADRGDGHPALVGGVLCLPARPGMSANLLSMGAIDFGIIVDGAVILVEHLFHEVPARRPDSPESAPAP
jgi:hypothetical protein